MPQSALFELLVVIAIIGVLAAILIPAIQNVRINAYVSKTSSNLRPPISCSPRITTGSI